MKLPAQEFSQLPIRQKMCVLASILAHHVNPETGRFENQTPKNILADYFEGDRLDRNSKATYFTNLLRDQGVLVNRRKATGVVGEWYLVWPEGLPRDLNTLYYMEVHSVAAQLLKRYGSLRCKDIIAALQQQMGA